MNVCHWWDVRWCSNNAHVVKLKIIHVNNSNSNQLLSACVCVCVVGWDKWGAYHSFGVEWRLYSLVRMWSGKLVGFIFVYWLWLWCDDEKKIVAHVHYFFCLFFSSSPHSTLPFSFSLNLLLVILSLVALFLCVPCAWWNINWDSACELTHASTCVYIFIEFSEHCFCAGIALLHRHHFRIQKNKHREQPQWKWKREREKENGDDDDEENTH